MVIRKKKCWDCGNAITHNTVCCPYCGSVPDPFGYYRNTDRIVTILLALIIVVLLTTVSVSVYILCSW
ncbi:hypothetical protein ACLB1S_18520 [Escherichia coli]